MSTPNMSGRTDAPDTTETLDATDLLTDGRIDHSKIKSITNAHNGSDRMLSLARCGDLREYLLDCDHAGDTATEFGIGETATRRHAKGNCHHEPKCVAHPPLTFVRGEGWRVDE